MKKPGRRSRRLETVLGAVATPLFVLDAKRTVVFFNSGCEELTGWPAADVAGNVCDYAAGADPAKVDSLTGRLAPPPEVLTGREASVPTEFLRRDGRRVTRMLHFFPLADEQGRVRSIVGVAVPIREPETIAATSPARQLHAELAALRVLLRQRFGQGTFIGRCPAMLRALRQIEVAATAAAGVLIQGEPGSGREHAARSIHLQSAVGGRPFVPLDCGRLPAPELKQTLKRLLDSVREGEATGTAANLRPGTLYLADAESLPRDLQQLLVDWFAPHVSPSSAAANSSAPFPASALRLTVSTSADFDDLLRQGNLIEDFYFLATAIRIELPPLRRREGDLELLAQAFLEELNRGEERQLAGFAPDAWRLLHEYNWPGNLDELSQVIAAAGTAAQGELIQPGDLPFRFRAGLDAQSVGPAVEPPPAPLDDLLQQVEADHIRTVLQQTRYNKTKAAAILGIPRPRLYRRMEALGIEDHDEG